MPNGDTGVFKPQKALATEMLKGTTPTILFHGGSYTINGHNIPLHTIFPVQFILGLGSLDMSRQTRVSYEECVTYYM